MVHLIFCFLSQVPSRSINIKEHNVPTDNASIVLQQAVFQNIVFCFREGFKVFICEENREVEEFVVGHRMNVPIKPPYKLRVQPLQYYQRMQRSGRIRWLPVLSWYPPNFPCLCLTETPQTTRLTTPENKNTEIPPPPSNILSPYLSTARLKLHIKLVIGTKRIQICQYLKIPTQSRTTNKIGKIAIVHSTMMSMLSQYWVENQLKTEYQNLPKSKLHSKAKAEIKMRIVKVDRVSFFRGVHIRVQLSKNRILGLRQYCWVVMALVVRAKPPMKIRKNIWVIINIKANILCQLLATFWATLARDSQVIIIVLFLIITLYLFTNKTTQIQRFLYLVLNHRFSLFPLSHGYECNILQILHIILLQIKMSIMYQNKTYKGPQFETEQKPIKQTTSFASKKQRFNYKIQKSPGPGAYDYSTTNYKTPMYHVKKDADKQSPIKREHQWIWGSNRLSYVQAQNYSTYIGPGSYNPSGSFNTHNTNWGKSERFYIKNSNYDTAPGPGTYESIGSKPKKGAVSMFKSKSPRTFIEKLLSQSSMPDLKKNQIQQFIQNPEVPQKSLERSQSTQKQGKQKVQKNSVFASKIPRFAQDTHNVNKNIGPGSYEVPELSKSRSKEKLPKIVIIKGDDRKKKIIKSEIQMPGPGSYDLNLKTIEKQLEGKRSVVICNQARFAQKTQKMPGPGQYLQNKTAFRSQFQKSQKLSPQKPSFNSSSSRAPAELPSKSNPLCAYNLQYFDLQYRIKKSKEHLQKLKIMQVTIPAFNTKAKR